jgi:hypothetical protein
MTSLKAIVNCSLLRPVQSKPCQEASLDPILNWEWSAEIVDDFIFEFTCRVSHSYLVPLQEIFWVFSKRRDIDVFLEVFRGEGEDIRWFFGGEGVVLGMGRRVVVVVPS